MTITEEQRTALWEGFNSPTLTLGKGKGSADGGILSGIRCTIAEINLILTGKLTDDHHPCISEVIRKWVIRVQDRMPDSIRNSPEWRQAAIGIAGSAASLEIEKQRANLILDWMWEALGDEALLKVIPEESRPAWDNMLQQRNSAAAAHSAKNAADAANAAYATYVAADAANAAYATYVAAAVVNAGYAAASAAAANADAADAIDFWERHNPVEVLQQLIKLS